MRLLRQNLSLVAGDCHLATSLSRSLEVAKQSSSVYRGRVPLPPSSQSGVSSTSKTLAATPDDGPRCSCRRCDSDESLARNLKNTRLSSTRPSVSSSEKPKATQMGPTHPITTRIGPTRPEATKGSPPRGLLVSPGESYVSRTTHLVPHPTRVAKGVILLPARGDLETLLTPQESPRE